MLKIKIFIVLMAFKNFFAPSTGEKGMSGFHMAKGGYIIKNTGNLPDSILETSGLEVKDSLKSFWIHGDGGSSSKLFEIKETGEVLSSLSIPVLNKDWEDMTKDDSGNIYIGDFGNNLNRRKDLKIYKLNPKGEHVGSIEFSFPDQKNFPPSKEEVNFDCEAVFYYKDSLFLFSKNRGHKKVKMYSLPVVPGKYVASVSDEFYLNSMITGGDISPDKKCVALLSYGKIYFFKITESEGTVKLKADFSKKFNKGQTEAIVFINETDLLISSEQGRLFLVKKKKP